MKNFLFGVLKIFEFGFLNLNCQACKFFGNSSGINVAREICAGMNSIFYHFDQKEWKSLAGQVFFTSSCKRWLVYASFGWTVLANLLLTPIYDF
jgi:hypothetical protein